MRRRGYLVDQPGSAKAMQSILAQFAREHPGVELRLTESGEQFSTAEEDLAELAAEDAFFADYAIYRAAEKLVSTYLRKMDRPRLLPEVRLPAGDGPDLLRRRLQPPEPAQGEGRGGRRRHDPRLLRAGRGQGLHRQRLLADRAGRARLRPGAPVRPGHRRCRDLVNGGRTSTGSSPPPCWARTPRRSPRPSGTAPSRSPSAGPAAWAPSGCGGSPRRPTART